MTDNSASAGMRRLVFAVPVSVAEHLIFARAKSLILAASQIVRQFRYLHSQASANERTRAKWRLHVQPQPLAARDVGPDGPQLGC